MLARCLAIASAILLFSHSSTFANDQVAQATQQASTDREEANQNTVTILASSTSSIYTQYVEDIFKVLDDRRENELRVLPVLSRGAIHNVFDILNLRGIDMGLTESIMLDHYKRMNPAKYGNIDQRIHYIAKIANTEYHIITKKSIKDIRELAGKKVNFFKKESGTALVGLDLFATLNIPIQPVFTFGEEANRMLKSGEIAAAARAAGAPGKFLLNYKEEDGLHLLPIDSSIPGYDELRRKYLPAVLTSEQYPALIPQGEKIPTIANATMLAVYAWPENTPRYRKVANFVNKFFNNIDKFMLDPRHPKWRQINLAAKVPGWTRFKAAQEWLDNNKARLSRVASIRPAFEKFVKEYSKNNSDVSLDDGQMKVLASEFMKWWQKQNVAQ